MSAEEVGGYGITGHYGKGGSGKSRDIVETDIIPALQKGRKVITNLPLLIDGIMTYFRGIDYHNIIIVSHEELRQKMVDRLARGKENPGEYAHTMIVWDEIQDDFPSGFKRKGTTKAEQEKYDLEREAFIAYLAWSRHDDSEFIWATQHYSSVDVELRRKTHIFVQHEHLFHLGMKKTWAARNQLPDLQTGDPLPDSGTSRTFGENKIIFRCYKSAEVGNHKASSRQKLMLPKKIVIVFALAILVGGWSIWKFTTSPSIIKPETKTDTTKSASIITPSFNAKDTTKRGKNENRASVDSYICMYGTCTGYYAGVPGPSWPHDIAKLPDSSYRPLRVRLLAGDVP